MAKTYLPAGGGLTFKSVLRFVGPSPLDGRGVVNSLSDIREQAYKRTFGGEEFEGVDSYYEGMLVVTKDTGKLYVLHEGVFKELTPDLSGLEDTYVPKTLTINNKPLSSNITLSYSDVSALSSKVTALNDGFSGKYYLTTINSSLAEGLNIRNNETDSVYIDYDSTSKTRLHANSFVGDLVGTSSRAVVSDSTLALADAPVLTASENTIAVTAGGKKSANFTVPYAETAETAKSINWNTLLENVTVTVGLRPEGESEVDRTTLYTTKQSILNKLNNYTVFIKETKESQFDSNIVVTVDSEDDNWEISCVKSNGFVIPMDKVDNDFISNNLIISGNGLENIEILLTRV